MTVSMSDVPTPQKPSGSDWSGAIKSALSSRHFCIAGVLLLLATLGWNRAEEWWAFYLIKKPVPAPAIVKVDKKYRVTNFPARIGPYELVAKSDQSLPDDVLDAMGTPKSPHNWYYMGMYVDKKANQAVQFNVTYYTGLQDAVPHVAERCVVASGGQIESRQTVPMSFSGLPSAWSGAWSKLGVFRTGYQTRTGRYFQYHVFSMNGDPTASWETVRAKLTIPWVKYCYFAKIEVSAPIPDLPEQTCDEMCQRFLSYVLPVVLPYLPTRQDVERAALEGK
jgi:hypothetical protein